MPKLSVWMIRSALIYLCLGFTFGALLLSNKGIPFYPLTWRLLDAHIVCLLIGWLVQLAMGVAFYALPRIPIHEQRYGNVRLGWISWGLLNCGIVAVSIGAWFTFPIGNLLGYCLILAAFIVYVSLMWQRVKPFAHPSLS